MNVSSVVNASTYDRTLWRCYVSANAAFWATSLFCRGLDVYFPALRKTQGPKSYFSRATWDHAVRVALMNIVVVAAGTVPVGAALFRLPAPVSSSVSSSSPAAPRRACVRAAWLSPSAEAKRLSTFAALLRGVVRAAAE